MRPRSAFLFLFLTGLLPISVLAKPPNIVLIMADDLGYGDIGCYGSKVNHTPHLDRLAASGMRFTDFHSNGPMCSPTRAALLTGRYPSRFGRRFESALSGSRRDPGLPLKAVTIAEVLRERGYATGMFGKWHLGYEPPFLPTRQGFDEFRGLLSGDGDFHTRVDRSGNEDWWKNEVLNMEEGYTTDLITQHSVSFIEHHRDDPFFLYIPHLAIHFPWQGPGDPPHRRAGTAYYNDKWGIIPDRGNVQPHVTAMIERLDDSVGEIVAALEKGKLTDNTLLIFTSDNGGYREYRGGFKNISDMGPFRGQKATMYEGGHRVPMICSWPGKIAPGVNDETIMTFDLSSTIINLANATLKDEANFDGINLKDLLFHGSKLPQRTLFWRMGNGKAIRKGPWKVCIRGQDPPELYQLTSDPGESKNVASQHPEILRQLLEELSQWEKEVDQSARAFEN